MRKIQHIYKVQQLNKKHISMYNNDINENCAQNIGLGKCNVIGIKYYSDIFTRKKKKKID